MRPRSIKCEGCGKNIIFKQKTITITDIIDGRIDDDDFLEDQNDLRDRSGNTKANNNICSDCIQQKLTSIHSSFSSDRSFQVQNESRTKNNRLKKIPPPSAILLLLINIIVCIFSLWFCVETIFDFSVIFNSSTTNSVFCHLLMCIALKFLLQFTLSRSEKYKLDSPVISEDEEIDQQQNTVFSNSFHKLVPNRDYATLIFISLCAALIFGARNYALKTQHTQTLTTTTKIERHKLESELEKEQMNELAANEQIIQQLFNFIISWFKILTPSMLAICICLAFEVWTSICIIDLEFKLFERTKLKHKQVHESPIRFQRLESKTSKQIKNPLSESTISSLSEDVSFLSLRRNNNNNNNNTNVNNSHHNNNSNNKTTTTTMKTKNPLSESSISSLSEDVSFLSLK